MDYWEYLYWQKQAELNRESIKLQMEQYAQTIQIINALDYRNAFYDIDRMNNKIIQQQEPYITVFESKPIKGIVLELVTLNPNYKEGSNGF